VNEIKDELMSLNGKIITVLSELAEFTPRFYHAVKNDKLKGYASKLTTFRLELNELDKRLEPHTRIPGDINSVTMTSGKLTIVFSVRNLTLTSLDEAQKILSSYEALAGFKLSTSLSLLAIVISAISLGG
jgi:hypothetical protein